MILTQRWWRSCLYEQAPEWCLSVCMYVPWLCVTSQIWSASQTLTPVHASSPPTSTSLLKSWTWRSSPFQAAVGICRKKKCSCAAVFVQLPLFFHWLHFVPSCRASSVQSLRSVQPLREHVGRSLHGLLSAPNTGGVALLQRCQVWSCQST